LAIDAVRHGAQDYFFKDKLPPGALFMRMLHFAISRKQMEVQLKSMTLELNRSNDDLMQFAHTAAHNLKQPLHNIVGLIHVLEDTFKGRLDPASAHNIHLLVRSAKQMVALIDDLMRYSSVGSSGLNIQQVSIEDALQIAIENLHSVISENDAVILHDPLPTILCDNTQIVCLLENLVENAIKFCSRKAPRIQITAEKNHAELIFSVRDNGIGIDSQSQCKIFDVFERLHSQSEYPGTGIGLAICKKIVERHKGRIWVDSRLGEGASFHFTLSEGVE